MKRAIIFKFLLLIAVSIIFGILIFIAELNARKQQGYLIRSFKLVKSNFYELDRMRIWNQKAYAINPSYFREWPIPLEFFEGKSRFPYFIYKPNIRMALENSRLVPAKNDDSVYYFINSFGMKSPEIQKKKTAGVIRIATLGASTTEGSSGNENTYSAQLEKILKQQGFEVEIINAEHG